ncbi:DUF397 domain-containing protein [Streptomyces albus subsp. chlorinus]|uniref:DUF397 domain-containing protein n=1 Tax=Streptomyces albus TaxID=1888 RepID=UPI00157065B8|nr:DUF397 domain-containing protein [Streptomyces albus]NSC22331.1 DUF397 domain-containing protein [Streptomyces albus subsp. chlorinus]
MTSGLSWHKSSYSGSGGGNCVEVAHACATVHVRDSKEQCGPVLSVPSHQWVGFIRHLAGEPYKG